MEKIAYISINGLPAVGKSGLLRKLLASSYRVQFLARDNTRPRRPDEKNSLEYNFISKKEFNSRKKRGYYIPGTTTHEEVNGKFYPRAIPRPEYWPITPEGTELVLAFFGKSAFLIRESILPDMRLVYISHHSLVEMRLRVTARCQKDGIDSLPKLQELNYLYRSMPWLEYDDVVWDDGTPEQCAVAILKIAEKIRNMPLTGDYS